MIDPFSEDPWGNDDFPSQAPDGFDTKVDVDKEHVLPNGEPRIVVTLKGGRDFDAPWIVVHADTVTEADQRIKEIFSSGLADNTLKAAKSFAGSVSSPMPQSQPPGPVKTCDHGQRVFKSGNGNKGPWSGWFCPAPKDDPSQCKPIWGK